MSQTPHDKRVPDRWELFPSANHLSPLLRGVYTLAAVIGTLVLALTLFIIVLEVTTTPGVSRWTERLTIGAAVLSAAHVLREARSTRPLSWKQWIAFLFAAALLLTEMWMTVADRTAQRVFSVAFGIGVLALFIARAIIAERATKAMN